MCDLRLGWACSVGRASLGLRRVLGHGGVGGVRQNSRGGGIRGTGLEVECSLGK